MDLSWLNNLALAAGITVAVYAAWRLVGPAPSPGIDEAALASAIASGAVLIDVRTPAEYAASHLPSARNVPLDELPRRTRELRPKERPLLLYCRSGSRSSQARAILEREGFERVIDLGSQPSAERAMRAATSRPAASLSASR
jgi:rhodanese-related sulfurtransferase